MKYRIDYCDGRYYLVPLEPNENGVWFSVIELNEVEQKRWDRYLDEEAYWQDKFRKVDNANEDAAWQKYKQKLGLK